MMFALASSYPAQTPTTPIDQPSLTKIFGFENEHSGDKPGGWSANPASTVFSDDKIVHGGKWSVRIERGPQSEGQFSVIGRSIAWEFSGKRIEMRGFLRTEGVTGYAGLWMRQDNGAEMLSLENMQSQELKGTHDWAEYKITLPIQAETRSLVFGFLMAGTGKAWADDFQILVDGKPLWETPKAPRAETVLDRDHEYDSGSRIVLSKLSDVQIQNLTTLGKVWGFVKYHHPLITAGERHWDYELLRVLPSIVSAPDRNTANAALAKWIAGLGPVKPCDCVKLDQNEIHLRPRLEWLANTKLLGVELSASLRSIYANRVVNTRQFYVSKTPQVGNASFDHELSYPNIKLPDAGFQLVALYRFWNIIEYWFPYRDQVPENWDTVLSDSLPKVAVAETAEAYQLAMIELIARVHDSHANLWSSLKVRPPTGTCQLPVNVRFVEGRPVISGYAAKAGETSGMKPGDIITELDGVAIAKLMERWTRYYAASNEASRLRDIALQMTRGECGKATLRLRRNNVAIEIGSERVPLTELNAIAYTHDLPGETFRLLSKDVAYLKLSSVKVEQAAKYVEAAAGTKGLIIDIRNYPSEFMVFALGSLLVDKQTDFVRFTQGDLSNPGAFYWGRPLSLKPEQPHYPGKVVILVDEFSQSQAEYTAMAFRSSARATVIGSMTAGADGNVSAIPLPGGFRSMISGISVFYPDKKPTQRVGIIPDREVRPTIAGIRAGRDEVLEAGIREIVGKDVAAAEIEKMIKP
ncbi:MAG TPA: S41 family peptidase [Pyrinomonadaceae bacterium]|jgi:C-terminal processing protease CtpA/Prc|nr:S41 family peptidase [Pyrinomonadaceae bacterium]